MGGKRGGVGERVGMSSFHGGWFHTDMFGNLPWKWILLFVCFICFRSFVCFRGSVSGQRKPPFI